MSNHLTGLAPSLSRPPPGFFPVTRPREVAWCAAPHFSPSRKSAAYKAGLRYEKKIKEELLSLYGYLITPGPFVEFIDLNRKRYCQPDAVLNVEDEVVIFEIKIRWSELAWWQLEKLYFPVVSQLFPDCHVHRVCICRAFDPHIPTPSQVEILDSLAQRPQFGMGVFVWKI